MTTSHRSRTTRYRVVSRGRASVARVVPARHALSRRPPAATTPAVPTVDSCGPRPARRSGGHYSCTFVDHFDGDALDGERWTGMNLKSHDADLCIRAGAPTIDVAAGTLRLSAVSTNDSFQCPLRADGTRASYAAGWVTTHGRFSQQYGRFEARMKVQSASTPGLQEAFWLWPDVRYGSDADWPRTGEIDIVETYSQHPDLAVPFLHYSADAQGPVDGLNTAWDCPTTRGEWHTYALEWTADRLEILVDGKTCLVNTDGAASFRKRFIINLTQLLGSGSNLYSEDIPLPATMEVDHVKVWQ